MASLDEGTDPLIPGLGAIAERYDAFIIDLWGVLHDGVTAMPGALEALTGLRAAKKRVVILSNAPRRAEDVARRTAEIGIAPTLYDALYSSGEETWQSLKTRPDAFYRKLGRRGYHLGPARDRSLIAGLDLDWTVAVDKAEFILNTGAHLASDELTAYEAVLGPAAALSLPMICANPDLEVIRGGVREICAGLLAQRYEALGGFVRYHGKPHLSVYRSALALIGAPPLGRVAAIGDSLRTDIAGAAGLGIASILVAGGIHGDELGAAAGAHPDPRALRRLCASAGVHPTWALGLLSW